MINKNVKVRLKFKGYPAYASQARVFFYFRNFNELKLNWVVSVEQSKLINGRQIKQQTFI